VVEPLVAIARFSLHPIPLNTPQAESALRVVNSRLRSAVCCYSVLWPKK
jgi:hypothetical protein